MLMHLKILGSKDDTLTVALAFYPHQMCVQKQAVKTKNISIPCNFLTGIKIGAIGYNKNTTMMILNIQ